MLIKLKSEVSHERMVSILTNNHADVIAEIEQNRLYHVRISDDQLIESIISRLISYEEIEYAEPSYRHETQKK